VHIRTTAIAAAACAALASPALAHHGFGRFDMTAEAHYSGTLTGIDLVNPHSYMNFDAVLENGETISMRCEMRAATLIRRMGWDTEMFVLGSHVEVFGRPHRDDPHSCYLETFTLGDAPAVNRNDLFATEAVDTSDRPLRLASGEPNISGDWAVEQNVLTVPPEGGNGSLVPKRFVEDFAAGRITLEEIRAQSPSRRPTATYTEAGQAAADAFRQWAPEDNPRLRCKPTSILFDWTFDWPVNRITQEADRIVIDYGLITAQRVIHMGLTEHPADITPSNTGHSIGRWEGDTLVVDTVGFEPGVIAPPTRNSDQLHVVERFTLDPEKMEITREYTAEDPVYLAAPYEGSDVVLLSEIPWQAQPCEELTYEFSDGAEAEAERRATTTP
jgi:hypothetical protein